MVWWDILLGHVTAAGPGCGGYENRRLRRPRDGRLNPVIIIQVTPGFDYRSCGVQPASTQLLGSGFAGGRRAAPA